MKQQSIPQGSAAAIPSRAPKSVVMGQGLVTPAVREHLGKTAKAATAKPRSVVMGQGLVTPAVREHLGKAIQRRQASEKR